MRTLLTTREVIEALDGVPAMTKALGFDNESRIYNWLDDGFPASAYVAIQTLLKKKRCRAADALFPKMIGVGSSGRREAA